MPAVPSQIILKNLALCRDMGSDTMTVGSYVEQLERTKKTLEEELIYYGIVLFGDWELVTQLTKKFSLWK